MCCDFLLFIQISNIEYLFYWFRRREGLFDERRHIFSENGEDNDVNDEEMAPLATEVVEDVETWRSLALVEKSRKFRTWVSTMTIGLKLRMQKCNFSYLHLFIFSFSVYHA